MVLSHLVFCFDFGDALYRFEAYLGHGTAIVHSRLITNGVVGGAGVREFIATRVVNNRSEKVTRLE
jgi:hypothetical protein